MSATTTTFDLENVQKESLKPKNFLNLLKSDKEFEDEFCFLNRKTHPYDWQIVTY